MVGLGRGRAARRCGRGDRARSASHGSGHRDRGARARRSLTGCRRWSTAAAAVGRSAVPTAASHRRRPVRDRWRDACRPPIAAPTLTPSPAGSRGRRASRRAPTIRYPYAHLAFDCITSRHDPGDHRQDLAARADQRPSSRRPIGRSTPAPATGARRRVSRSVRSRSGSIGDAARSPAAPTSCAEVTTDSDKDIAVNGATGTTCCRRRMTPRPGVRRRRRHQGQQARSFWIVTVSVGTDDVSLVVHLDPRPREVVLAEGAGH